MINPDEYRRIATDYLLRFLTETAEDVGSLAEHLDEEVGHDGWTDADCEEIDRLLTVAEVLVTWPQEYVHWLARCVCSYPVAVARIQDHPTYEQARAELVGWQPGYALEQITHKQWSERELPNFGHHRDDCPVPVTKSAGGAT